MIICLVFWWFNVNLFVDNNFWAFNKSLLSICSVSMNGCPRHEKIVSSANKLEYVVSRKFGRSFV